ncbi:polyamine oxidase 7-like isoform X2 [Anneissia japonica]|uniref:polyamine oxidase 7-like isoform X2 n=1 Tax=Anneissia japonica TaxID=1529436 RepID=UPI0014255EC2|nr:polyamine oxidase 7-like isoform X2 [Anneissia japonica]
MPVLKFYFVIALLTLTISMEAESATDAKVLILGAGASGLNAAQTLHYKGENDFLILEAEDHYGGRVHNVRFLQRVVELGANWIRPTGSKLENLAQKIELATRPSDFDDIVALTNKGAIVTDGFKLALERFDSKLDEALDLGADHIDDEETDMSLRSALKYVGWKPMTPEEKLAEWFRIDFDLADEPERASLLAYAADKLYTEEDEPVVEDNSNNNNNNINEQDYLKEQRDLVLVADNDPYNYRNRDRYDDNNQYSRRRRQAYDGSQEQFVIDKDGYIQIFNETMTFLMKRDYRDNILYNKVVERIDYSNDREVTVFCRDGTSYTAEYVLVTFSLGVLQSDLIEFVPALPLWKTTYWNRFEMAAYSKIFLNYNERNGRFWAGEEYDKEWFANVHSSNRKGMWPLFLNFAHGDLFGKDTHMLMAILTGDEARRVESLTETEIMREAENTLDSMFNRYDVPLPNSILVSNWTQNPYTLGSYAIWTLGMERDCFDKMESRVGRVFFAGEATSFNNTGNLQGALESGKREGLKIYNCIYSSSCKQWKTGTKCGCKSGVAEGTNRQGKYGQENATSSSNSTSLTIGIFFVGMIVGTFGVGLIVGFISYKKIKQKAQVDKGSTDKKMPHTYMDYVAVRPTAGSQNQTYQDNLEKKKQAMLM